MLRFFVVLFLFVSRTVLASTWLQVGAGYGVATGTAVLTNVTDKLKKAQVPFLKKAVYSLTGEGAYQATSFFFDASMALSTSDRNMNFTQLSFGVRYYPTYQNLLPSNRPMVSFGRISTFDGFVLIGIVNTSFDLHLTNSLGVAQDASVSGIGFIAGGGFDMPVGGNTDAGGRFSDWEGLVFYIEGRGVFMPLSTSQAGILSTYGTLSLGLRYRL